MGRRRTSRKPKRSSKSTKRTSRGLRANTIPPPPFGHIDLGHWAKRTFAVGTPVRLRMPWDFRSGQDAFPRVFPAGTRAEVVDLESTGLTIRTKVVSPLLLSAEREGFYADVYYSSAAQVLEPLVDNWGPSAPPSKRTSLPKSQRGLSMKHRRLMPNATCPACGSPDYFEGPWNRDCATPDCRYFRGGTAKGPHYESESVVAKPLGSRRLGFTSETVHPSEPDVYPEIDNEGLDDIVIDADDLDEDETFAERAAKIIGEELGHVEGSDGGRGPSRWYTQADASEDYSTGESERRSIHIDDKEWTPEEQQEIYDDLKKRRLIS